MDDELVAAVDDFEEALREGPAEGLRSLQSYDLSGAPGEALAALVTSFAEHLGANEATLSAKTLAQRAELVGALGELLGGDPPLAAQLQASWQRSLGAELLNAGEREVEEHLQRVRALRQGLSDAVAGAAAALRTDFDVSRDVVRRSIVQASLFALSLFQNDPSLESELERLVEAVMGPCRHGATALGVAAVMQGAFEAALDAAQSSELHRALDSMCKTTQTQFWGRAGSLLSVLRRGPAGDVWWGAHASAVLQLAEAVAQHGRGHPALEAVTALLCCPDAAAPCLHTLLARAGDGGAKGAQAAFQTAQTLLQDHPGAFVSACCTVLKPETNAALALRVQAVQSARGALARAAAVAAAAGHEDETLALEPAALFNTIFALKRDPSVRLRRKGMELLRLLCERPLAAGGPAAVAAAAAQRCFDQDPDVRRAAYGCLEAVPMPGDLPPAQWQRAIEEGLAAGAANAGSKQAREIAGAAKRLLEKYLRQGEGGALGRLEELLAGGGRGQTVSPEVLAALSGILTDEDLAQHETGADGA